MRFGLVFACDVVDEAVAHDITLSVLQHLDGIKIGAPLTLKIGINGVRRLIRSIREQHADKIIIVDYKLADVGIFRDGRWQGVNARIVELLSDLEVDYVICHGITGIDAIRECIDVAHEHDVKVLAIAHMTHRGADLFFSHPLDVKHVMSELKSYGLDVSSERLRECKTVMDLIVVLGETLGADGYVCPANKPNVLRRVRELTRKPILGPGVGRQGAAHLSIRDQMRMFYSICGESSAIVVGSLIYEAESPKRRAEEIRIIRDEIVQELTKGF